MTGDFFYGSAGFWFRVFVNQTLDQLCAYIHEADRALKKRADDYESDPVDAPPSDDYETRVAWSGLREVEFREDFPRILRGSLVVSTHAYVESLLNRLCEELEVARSHRLTLTDLHGRGLNRAAAYLQKVEGVELPMGDEWDRLKIYGAARNAIVHNGSSAARRSHQALRDFVTAFPELIGIDGDLICPTLEGCLDHVRCAQRFFHALLDRVPDWDWDPTTNPSN